MNAFAFALARENIDGKECLSCVYMAFTFWSSLKFCPRNSSVTLMIFALCLFLSLPTPFSRRFFSSGENIDERYSMTSDASVDECFSKRKLSSLLPEKQDSDDDEDEDEAKEKNLLSSSRSSSMLPNVNTRLRRSQ